MLRLKNPQSFKPQIRVVDGRLILDHQPWDMRVVADSYDELEQRVIAHVILIWKLLVERSDESALTTRGMAIRRSLLEDFDEYA